MDVGACIARCTLLCLFDKLEFGGLWPLTMRYELHQSNSILWALDQLLVSALRTEFT